MKFLKHALFAAIGLVLVAFLGLTARTYMDRQIAYDVALNGTEVPKFSEIAVPFDHAHSDETSLPFTGGAVIDIDGDGTDELFIGGGFQQKDNLFRFTGSAFEPIANAAGISKDGDNSTLSALVIDANKDGRQDLIVTRRTGIYLYTNNGGSFSGVKLDAPLLEDTTALSIAVADINRDGHLDLVVAHDTGQVKTWENTGGGQFKDLPNPNSSVYSYPTGIAIGDYDNNGFVDFMFSNVGSTPPNFMVRGDLRDDHQRLQQRRVARHCAHQCRRTVKGVSQQNR